MTGRVWFGTPEGAAELLWNVEARCIHRPRWDEAPWNCSECAEDMIRTAVEIERAAIVAYLRSDHASACCKDSYANEIERGEHHR